MGCNNSKPVSVSTKVIVSKGSGKDAQNAYYIFEGPKKREETSIFDFTRCCMEDSSRATSSQEFRLDLTNSPPLGPLLKASVLPTKPIEGQKPGTSGLRKKTKVFMEGYYLHNFVQSTFNSLLASGVDLADGSLLIGGDGRYYNKEAIQIIIKIAVANGVRRIIIGKDGLFSTPAVSAYIREAQPLWKKPFGSFILTASHNPGGPNEDFGIKYNCENGGPAPEYLTNAIYEITKSISSIKICEKFPKIDISKVGTTVVRSDDGNLLIPIDVVSSTEVHVTLLKTVFDFDAIKTLIQRPFFSFRYDCMHGVQGPYAYECFVKELGASPDSLMNATPKDDFAGATLPRLSNALFLSISKTMYLYFFTSMVAGNHADPNLTYARDLCDVMGVDAKGVAVKGASSQ